MSGTMVDTFNPVGKRKTPMYYGGTNVPDLVKQNQPSIFRDPNNLQKPRVKLPVENPAYPETKHTVKCVRA